MEETVVGGRKGVVISERGYTAIDCPEGGYDVGVIRSMVANLYLSSPALYRRDG